MRIEIFASWTCYESLSCQHYAKHIKMVKMVTPIIYAVIKFVFITHQCCIISWNVVESRSQNVSSMYYKNKRKAQVVKATK